MILTELVLVCTILVTGCVVCVCLLGLFKLRYAMFLHINKHLSNGQLREQLDDIKNILKTIKEFNK